MYQNLFLTSGDKATSSFGKGFITESDQMKAIVLNPEQVAGKLINRPILGHSRKYKPKYNLFGNLIRWKEGYARSLEKDS